MKTRKILFSKTVIALFTMMWLATSLKSQPEEQWTATYNGPGNWLDEAVDIILDSEGNVYVTGWSATNYMNSNYDYATIKYDSDGNQLWVVRYNGPGNSIDQASAITIDGSGSVYVTGMSCQGIEADPDFATVKYDNNGNQLWVARYDNIDDYAVDIKVDNDGNVYVTGTSGAIGAYDIVTIKYDGNGNQLWAEIYNGDAGGTDVVEGLVLDASGNVYVTGSEAELTGFDPITDYVTIKYNTDGENLWVTKYNGPGEMYDIATAITIDMAGNIYITGSSEHAPDSTGWFDNDYATVKYSPNGDELCVARYDGNWGGDFATDVVVDSVGNIFVTGWSISSVDTKNYATIKYNPEGNEQWVSIYSGAGHYYNEPNAIDLDNSGNIYVAGFMEQQSDIELKDLDYAVIKYDNNGNECWVITYAGSENDDDRINAIVVNGEDNVYVTGHTYDDTDWDYTTVKYSVNTGINDDSAPNVSLFLQNYPNPFNLTTTFSFHLPQPSMVNLSIYNSKGQLIRSLMNEYKNPGYHSIKWDANNLPANVYLYRLETEKIVETRKLIVVK